MTVAIGAFLIFRETIFPVMESGREKSGAIVPKGSMEEVVFDIYISKYVTTVADLINGY
jgi:hypothetical protein